MGPLAARTALLCERAAAQLGPGFVRTEVERVRRQLAEPLRVAIAGQVSSGKSTLVNALLGRRIAATDHGECTQVVSCFRFGATSRAVLRLESGTRPLGLTPGGTIDRLGVRPEEVVRLDVYLDTPLLARMTVLDTPGLDSANEEASAVTERALALRLGGATRSTVREADAIVYLFHRDTEKGFDRRALDAFEATAMNTVGVLSHAETFGDGELDALEHAQRQADRICERLEGRLARVVPVAGLLAETVSCGDFDDTDLAALRVLAELPRADRLDWSLEGPYGLLAADADVPEAVRRRLWARLGRFGLLHCLDWIERDGVRDGQDLERGLHELSGVEDLVRVLEQDLLPRADPLKADAAIVRLKRASHLHADPENARALSKLLLSELDELAFDPAMHVFVEMSTLRLVIGNGALSSDQQNEIRRLFSEATVHAKLGVGAGSSPDELLAAAKSGSARWGAVDAHPLSSVQMRRIAGTVRTSYDFLWSELKRAASKGAAA